jgi:phage tail sheath protein FI
VAEKKGKQKPVYIEEVTRGARAIPSDPEWKYVTVRRRLTYIEESIDEGTQWVVFEPNGEQLWETVRRMVSAFLLNVWRDGSLVGEKQEEAFFVRCDRSTMTQNDIDHGRLVLLVGVAPVKPTEFVIFHIGQWTADRR